MSTLDTITRSPDRIDWHTPGGVRIATLKGEPADLDAMWPGLADGYRVVDVAGQPAASDRVAQG